MADNPSPTTTPADELEHKLGPAEPIEDELLAAADDLPIVEPQRAHVPRADSRSTTRAVWFVGAVMTALLVVQTLQIWRSSFATPPAEVAPAPRGGVNGSTERPPARTPDEEVDRLLYQARVQASRGQNEATIRVLEALIEDDKMLDRDQRWDAYMLLSRAHNALGNRERAHLYYQRATDMSVDRSAPSLAVDDASTLAADGRFPDARRRLFSLLARRDGVTRRDSSWVTTAEARVADAWYAQANASGHFAPLPGAETVAESAR